MAAATVSRRAAGCSGDQSAASRGGGSQTGSGSEQPPIAWSHRSANRGPNREQSSRRGSASSCSIRRTPKECNKATVSGGSRKASMGSGRKAAAVSPGGTRIAPRAASPKCAAAQAPPSVSAAANRADHPPAANSRTIRSDQRRLAAEQMGRPADVQQQARWVVAFFDAKERTEAAAPGGQ